MGRSYYGLGLYDEARSILHSAVALRLRSGEQGPDLADDQVLLARIAVDQGVGEAAVDSLARSALATARRALAPQDPTLAVLLNHLGLLRRDQGRDAEAESLSTEVIGILQRQPRIDQREMSEALRTLGDVHWSRADWAGAETLYRQALTLRQDTLGPDHPEVGRLKHLLGEVLRWEGKPEAERYLQDGITIQQRVLGLGHAHLAEGQLNLADLLAARGELAPAESLYREVITTFEKVNPGGHHMTATTLTRLGRIALRRGDTAGAESEFQAALAMWERVYPPERRYAFGGLLAEMGNLRIAQRRYAEAEPLLREVLSNAGQRWGEASPRTQWALRLVVALYEAWGKPEEAREYRRRLEQAPGGR